MNQASYTNYTAFGLIADPVLIFNRNWQLLYSNSAGELFLQKNNELVSGTATPLELSSQAQFIKDLCIKTGSYHQHLSTEVAHDEYWWEYTAYPGSDNWIVIVRNCTARKRTLDDIKRSEKQLRALIENNEGIISLTDEELNILFRNSAGDRITGWSTEELQTRAGLDYVHPEDIDNLQNAFEQARKHPGEPIPVLFRFLPKGKNYIWLEGVINNKMDDPEINGILSNLRDVTKRVKAEQAIQKSNERFLLAATASNDMIWDWNLQTNEIWWNNNYMELFGYDANVEINQISSWENSIHEEDRKRVVDGIYEVINSGKQFWTDEYRYQRKDGTILHIYDRGYVAYDENGKPSRMIGSMVNITERIKAEKAIRESEEKYRILVEQATDAIFIINHKGQFISFNSSAVKLSEYSAAELEQMTIFDFTLPEDIQTNPFRFAELATGVPVVTIRPMKRKSGQVLTVEVSAKMLTDGRILVFIRNITERMIAEEKLKASEEKYRTLVEQASDGIYIVSPEGKIITVNSSACRLSGYSEEDLLKMTIYDFVSSAELETTPFRFDDLRKGKTVVIQRKFKVKNNDILHVECTANALSDGRILVFARDIGERLKAEEALRQSEEKYRTLVEQASDGIYIADSQGRILTVNPSTCKLSLYAEEELLRMTIYDFVPETDLEKSPFRFDELMQGKTVVTERRIMQKGGNLLDVENTTKLLSDGRILVFVRDISERTRAQRLLKQSYEDIRRLASHLTKVREEERKRIGREIHDELGQQLTAIKMDVAWIEKKNTDSSPEIRNKIRNIISLLDSGNQSVRRILSELNPGIIDNDGLLDAINRQNRQFTSSTGIPVNFQTAETKVILSPEIANCIFRVYQESLTNIMRYAKAKNVSSALRLSKGTISVIIEDDGEGFDPASVRSKRTFGILGMKERVISQKGQFELFSEKGKGTRISVSLPDTTE